MSKLTNFDIPQSLETVWTALGEYRDECIPEGGLTVINTPETEAFAAQNEVLWSDITTAMAWITEALGYDISTADDETNGEYIQRVEDVPCKTCGGTDELHTNGNCGNCGRDPSEPGQDDDKYLVDEVPVPQAEQDLDFVCAAARDFVSQMEAETEGDGDDADGDTLIDIKKIGGALDRLGR